MLANLARTRQNLESLAWIEIIQVPQEMNGEADALKRLASEIEKNYHGTVPIELLTRSSVSTDDVSTIEDALAPTQP